MEQDLEEALNQLVQQCSSMRRLQRLYFRTRDRDVLKQSMTAEALVDQTLAFIQRLSSENADG